jgi:DnaJ family protein A protein 5
MRFFDATLWNNDFNDDSQESFFGIYRTLYETISQSEYYATAPHGEPALSTPPFHYPSFGTSTTSYDSSDSQLKTFYNGYLNFASRRSFSEVDKYRLSDAPDRRIKRMMEKENKRAREDARREYNDTIRNLTSFVKKRDPRFLKSNNASMKKDPLKLQQVEKERLNAKLRQAALQAAKEREENAKKFVVQDWQKVAGGEESDVYSEDDEAEVEEDGVEGDEADDGEEAGEDNEDEEVPDWYCPACDKDFSSQGAWDNHERSKKHLKNVEKLKREMQDEDNELGLSGQLRQVDILEMPDEEEERPIAMSKKDKKKLKKRFGVDLLGDDRNEDSPDGGVNMNPEDPSVDHNLETEAETNGHNGAKTPAPETDEQAGTTGTRTPMSGGEDSASQSATPQLSKKDKRRAREAAKKEQLAQQAGTSTPVEVSLFVRHNRLRRLIIVSVSEMQCVHGDFLFEKQALYAYQGGRTRGSRRCSNKGERCKEKGKAVARLR